MPVGHFTNELGNVTERDYPTSVLTQTGKRVLARAQKGSYESLVIALVIYKVVKNLPFPKNTQERDEQIDLQRTIAQAIRNRLDDPRARFEKSISEIAKSVGLDWPEPDDPRWITALENSNGTAGNSIKARDANSILGHGLHLGPKDAILGEVEIGDFKFQMS